MISVQKTHKYFVSYYDGNNVIRVYQTDSIIAFRAKLFMLRLCRKMFTIVE